MVKASPEISRHLSNCVDNSGRVKPSARMRGAVEPLQSAIKYFREEFEAGIKQQFSNTHAIGGIQPNLLKARW